MSAEQHASGSTQHAAGRVWSGVCGRDHDAGDVDRHRAHVVSPRELAPGFWVAIDVEEDLEHARARFLAPSVRTRSGAAGPGETGEPTR